MRGKTYMALNMRGARGIYDAKSLKENENWIIETTAHFYTSHGLCMCGGESKTFV